MYVCQRVFLCLGTKSKLLTFAGRDVTRERYTYVSVCVQQVSRMTTTTTMNDKLQITATTSTSLPDQRYNLKQRQQNCQFQPKFYAKNF